MTEVQARFVARWGVAVVAAAALSGCASVSLEQSLDQLNHHVEGFAGGKLSLARTPDERDARVRAAQKLLSAPLGQEQAVQLALLNSAALQALLAQGWANSAQMAQGGRIPNPVLSFERLLSGNELETGRTLSFGLLDILTLPARQEAAQRRAQEVQLRLAGEVVDHVVQVRQAWVRAVAAGQTLHYAQQVFESAEASAELSRRMHAVGNINRLSRAREQAFYADAATNLAAASHEAFATREALIRQLGLSASQAPRLQLPQRLPDLPAQAMDAATAGALAGRERLDILLARHAWEALGAGQGTRRADSFTDIELSVSRSTRTDRVEQTHSRSRGYEVGVRLPVFDWGELQREAWDANTLAAANRLEATLRAAASDLRESYLAYRTAYDVAKHYRNEVVPLRKVIAEENQLRYNAMIIGVFELLADARDQISTVTAAIGADRQFWLAEAQLQASRIGRPSAVPLSLSTVRAADAGGGSDGH